MPRKTYQYTILKFTPSLTNKQAKALPIAVILRSCDDGQIAVFGHNIKRPEGISELSWDVLQRISEIMSSQIREILETEPLSEHVFERLAAQNRWNLYLTPVANYQTSTPFELALYQLFLDHVSDEKNQPRNPQRSLLEEENIFKIASASPA